MVFPPPRRKNLRAAVCRATMGKTFTEVRYGRTEAVCGVPRQARRELFVRTLVEQGVLTAIRSEPGCLAYDYYFSAQDENELLLIERWESEAHQRVHLQQPHMDAVRAAKAQYIDSTELGKFRLED